MSTSKCFQAILVLVIMFTMPRSLESKPVIHTNDKGVTLPIMPSAVNQSWCRSALFKEHITEPGCESKLVYNRFCYGQCTSFYVPRFPLASFRTCNACVPVVTEKRFIKLNCPQRKDKVYLKQILLVKSCRCRADIWANTKSSGKKWTAWRSTGSWILAPAGYCGV